MKFTLTYEGELPSTGNGSKKTEVKWAIRKAFHPQLAELCQIHPIIREAISLACVPPKGRQFYGLETYHLDPPLSELTARENSEFRRLYEPIEKHGRKFFPVVRESMALACGLKIIFLRKEEPGRLILQGGDLDNRIKTLFDALRMPADKAEMVDDPTIDDPIYCLLESDALITQCDIKTDRLLTRPNSPPNQLHLLIEVDVKVTQARVYNYTFLSE